MSVWSRYRPGVTLTAADANAMRGQLDTLSRVSVSGAVGVEQSGRGIQITDLSQTRLLARLTSRGTGANYGWNQVIDNGDGTYTDQPTGLPDAPWGTPTAGPAWEVGGRIDVPVGSATDTPPGSIVELFPGGQDKANYYFRWGEGDSGKVRLVRLLSTGTGIDGGTAWNAMIRKEVAGVEVDWKILGTVDMPYVLYMDQAEDGTTGSAAPGDYTIAIPDPLLAGRWAFIPKLFRAVPCGEDCAWVVTIPQSACLQFRMTGGVGACACVPAESAESAGTGIYTAALGGWLATKMKTVCCGCGSALLVIDSSDPNEDITATLTLRNFHVSCAGGSGSGIFSLNMKLRCCGTLEETGEKFAKFQGWGPDPCDGDEDDCGNYFELLVICKPCPDPICRCCCEDVSPRGWFANNISTFASDTLNGDWVWEFDDDAVNCTWRATCTPGNGGSTVESTLEYLPGSSKMRLTHGTAIYEIDIASWSCHSTNVLTYVSGASGAHPAVIEIKPVGDYPVGTDPRCELPDTLTFTSTSPNCPILAGSHTVTRTLPGVEQWEWLNPGAGSRITAMTVQCVNGQWSASITGQCDASPTPIAFGFTAAASAITSQAFNPLELVWAGLVVNGTPTVGGCCAEGATGTITVTE